MAKGKRSTAGTTSTPTQPTTKERSVNKILPLKVRLKCKNTKQKDFVNLIKEKEIILCSGPAGVGKSYVAIAVALELLQDPDNSFHKILIVKPAVEAEENLGFLPGNLKPEFLSAPEIR